MAVSAASSLANAYTQSKAIRDQGRYEQQVADYNARLADLAAQDTLRIGQKESARVRREGKQVQGRQRAAYAARGVDVNVGTPSVIQEETRTLSESDQLRIQNNAWREAWGYRAEASQLRYQGRMAKQASKFQARQTLLTGVLQGSRDVALGAYLSQQSSPSELGLFGGGKSFKPRNPTEAKMHREQQAKMAKTA